MLIKNNAKNNTKNIIANKKVHTKIFIHRNEVIIIWIKK